LVYCTDVDGRLGRIPVVTDSLLSPSVSSELMSPPLCKDCKHGFAVAAIDAVQLAVIGPANKTNSGILHFILSCVDFSLYGVASGSTLVIFVF